MWIDECKRSIRPGLERMNIFMKDFNQNFKAIHVAGTNGKGSVCEFIYSALMIKSIAGVYTSPHLIRVNERIRVNGKEITNQEIEQYSWMRDYKFTYFEALTAMAFQYFNDKTANFAVIEAGMGGRLDATNVVVPEVSVITNVGMEHEKWLGRSVEKIAWEKAGIIKDAPVITSCSGDALDVIKKVASIRGADIYVNGIDFEWKYEDGYFRVYADREYVFHPKMNALYQGDNISMAVKALEILGAGREEIIKGINDAFIPARMQKTGKYIIDGAHNPEGIKALFSSLSTDDSKTVVIFGVMRDKNVKKMLSLIPSSMEIIATQVGNERAMKAEEIASIRNCMITRNVEEAIKASSNFDRVIITGSLYLAGEAIKLLNEKKLV